MEMQKWKSIINQLKKEIENVSKNENIYAYLFVMLMAGAKAFGLHSGQKSYLVISGIAAIAWIAAGMLELIRKNLTITEIGILGIWGILTGITFLYTGKYAMILPFMVAAVSKRVDFKRLVYVVGYEWIGVLLFKVSLVGLGIQKTSSWNEGRFWGATAKRYEMGFGAPNDFHAALFIAMAYYLLLTKKVTLKKTFFMLLINIAAFLLSYSTTGFILCTFVVVGMYVVKNIGEDKGKPLLKYTCVLIGVLPMAVSVYWTIFSKISVERIYTLNRMLSGRPEIMRDYYYNYPITLFGQQFDDRCTYILDNGYMFLLLQYGVIMFLLFTLGYVFFYIYFCKKNQLCILFITSVFLIYGFIEQYIWNCFMNFSILFMVELFWICMKNRKREEKYEPVV